MLENLLKICIVFQVMSADLTQEDCGYQSAFTYSKLTTETLEQGVKYVQI